MNSIGGKTLSPDIIGTATISGAKLFLMKDLKLIYIFQDKLIIKFYFKVTKRNANLPFLSVNFPSVCSEITSQIVCKFLQIIVGKFIGFLKQSLFLLKSFKFREPFYLIYWKARRIKQYVQAALTIDNKILELKVEHLEFQFLR